MKSDTINETIVRFRFGGMRKMPNSVRNIPWSGAKNQIKLDRKFERVSQVLRFGDRSDDLPGFTGVAIDNLNQGPPVKRAA